MGYGFVIPDFQRHFNSFFLKEKKELDIECLPGYQAELCTVSPEFPFIIRQPLSEQSA